MEDWTSKDAAKRHSKLSQLKRDYQARVHLRSDVSRDGQAGAGPRERRPKMLKGEFENNSRNLRDIAGELA